ncbi:ABC transporter ATP-binding protein, partial [Candidatus Beckwithbacteria bacterium CG23_combo_of_CG06-09_8_20_14_all_34_8]
MLYNVSLSIGKGERIALIGPNGAGKSTFIKTALGVIKPDRGYIIKDDNLKIGYYSQEFEQFNFDQNLFDFVTDKTHQPEWLVRGILGKFMFSGSKIYQSIGTLSGGEKTRLAIALLLTDNNNLLVLDEPTTYLDVLSQRII